MEPEYSVTHVLKKLFPNGEVFEIRGIHQDPTIRGKPSSGYFDNPDTAALEVAKQFKHLGSAYFTLNAVKPELLARAPNKFHNNHTATGDGDILKRVTLLIDVDPVRPGKVSATDAEKEAARLKALAIRDYLRAEWGVEPILIDSGNGFHLLFRIDLPNNKESTDMLRDVLKFLASKFNDDRVKIDTGVSNAARISALPGTWKRKGESTTERPHRITGIVECPETLEVVPMAKLQAMADRLPKVPEPDGQHADAGNHIDVPAWLAKYGIPIEKVIKETDKTIYHIKCPFWDHTGYTPYYVIQHKDGGVTAKCFSTDCQERGHHWFALRDKFEPGWRKREVIPQIKVSDVPDFWQVEDVPIEHIDESQLLVKNAMNMLAGQAGHGKTTLAVRLAANANSKGYSVLYLDRENPVPGMKSMVQRLNIQPGAAPFKWWGPWVRTVVDGKEKLVPAPDPSTETILEWVKEQKQSIVIIDSLAAYAAARGISENSSNEMRAMLDPWRGLLAYGATIILIHHTGKAETAQESRGSSAIKDVVDMHWVVLNKNSSGGTELETIYVKPAKTRLGTGSSKVFRYDGGRFTWDRANIAGQQEVARALTLILEDHPDGISATKFTDAAKKAGVSEKAARTWIQVAIEAGEVEEAAGRPGKKGGQVPKIYRLTAFVSHQGDENSLGF